MTNSERKPNIRKQELVELSAKLKVLVDLGNFKSLNDALIWHYKSQNPDITVFHTFNNWLLQGYKVKRGEKGYALWTKPILKKVSPEQPNPENPQEQQQYKFFGIFYVFSNLQVEKVI